MTELPPWYNDWNNRLFLPDSAKVMRTGICSFAPYMVRHCEAYSFDTHDNKVLPEDGCGEPIVQELNFGVFDGRATAVCGDESEFSEAILCSECKEKANGQMRSRKKGTSGRVYYGSTVQQGSPARLYAHLHQSRGAHPKAMAG